MSSVGSSFSTFGSGEHHPRASGRLTPLCELRFQPGVLLLQVRQLAIDRVPRGAVSRRSLQFEAALFEPYGFDLVVHRADVVELQSPDVLAVAFRPFHERLQRRPCLLRRPDDLPLAFGNLAHGADERAASRRST